MENGVFSDDEEEGGDICLLILEEAWRGGGRQLGIGWGWGLVRSNDVCTSCDFVMMITLCLSWNRTS